MLPTHLHVKALHGCDIYQRRPGFEYTPMMLGKIASFIVTTADGQVAVFAFMYSLLGLIAGDAIDEHALLADAVATIEHQIVAGRIGAQRDRTFEYRDGAYVEVTNPLWWIPTWPA